MTEQIGSHVGISHLDDGKSGPPPPIQNKGSHSAQAECTEKSEKTCLQS